MSKEKLLIKEKLINYSKRYYAKVIANNNKDVLCFDLQGAKMPKDTFKEEVRAFIKVQLEFNKTVSLRLDNLENDVSSLKNDVSNLKKDVESLKEKVN